jgi:hypothetical protein
MTQKELEHLKTLEEMDQNGVRLTEQEYALLRDYAAMDLLHCQFVVVQA